MTTTFDFSNTRTMRLVLPITDDDQAALKKAGIPVPNPPQVVLELREANLREIERYNNDQEAGGAAKADPWGWFVGLMLRRAEKGTDQRVLEEVVKGLGRSDIAALTHAYLTGEPSDPKLTGAAMQKTMTGTSGSLLEMLASLVPSPS